MNVLPGGYAWGRMPIKPKPDPQPAFDPAAFQALTPTDKLVWFYVRDHPGEWSRVTLAAALGMPNSVVTVNRALKALVGRGLLEVTKPAAGSRPGSYRAKEGTEHGD